MTGIIDYEEDLEKKKGTGLAPTWAVADTLMDEGRGVKNPALLRRVRRGIIEKEKFQKAKAAYDRPLDTGSGKLKNK